MKLKRILTYGHYKLVSLEKYDYSGKFYRYDDYWYFNTNGELIRRDSYYYKYYL